MYFIKEGKVEVLSRKKSVKPTMNQTIEYETTILEKGKFFGEVIFQQHLSIGGSYIKLKKDE